LVRTIYVGRQEHTAYRRDALQTMYQNIESEVEKLTQQVPEQAESRSAARRLMTNPGVGPVTALAPSGAKTS